MSIAQSKRQTDPTDTSAQEHTPLNPTLLVSLIRTIQYHSNGSMVPVVRIPGCSPELVPYALNAGAGGVIMPHIQNAKQAEELVRLARFPPMGDRSFPPAALINEQQNRTPKGQSTYDVWNNHAAVICQIEDLEGLENIEDICRVPGGTSYSFYSLVPHGQTLSHANISIWS
jgi:2-keto-3-deoxy-L-rhamnonate aldolase RhmA